MEDGSESRFTFPHLWYVVGGASHRRIAPFFSKSGKHLITVDGRDRLVWRNLANPEQVEHELDLGAEIAAIVSSPERTYLAVSSRRGMLIVDSGQAKLIGQSIEPRNVVLDFVFSPDESMLACGGKGQVAELYSSPDGQKVMAWGDLENAWNSSIGTAVWNSRTGELVHRLGQQVVGAIDFSSDHRLVATGSDGPPGLRWPDRPSLESRDGRAGI